MRGAAHLAVRRWWQGELGAPGAVLRALAAPLEWLYAAEVARRNRRADARGGARVEGLRVVSVGNLAVGGTGKTPLAAWAARALVQAGADVALVSRGYGRDELLLHHRWNPEVPVVADPDRVAAARLARERGAEAVVLDDGFQHRRLARDVDLVLLAAEDAFPGRLLPRGPYREGPRALARAHAVVVTRRTAAATKAATLADGVSGRFPHLAVAVAALLPGHWQDLSGAPAGAPTGPTLAVAAVARPDAFAVQVEEAIGVEAELVPFPDHHAFTEVEVRAMRQRAGTRTVVVTEKDAVKLVPYRTLLEPVRVLTQSLRWERGEDAVTRLVTGVARSSA
ncbi:MAG: hypothetical protein AMXMBFR53_40830 [Gemmatimonadota bacterium]